MTPADERRLEYLHIQHAEHVRKICALILRNREDAEDATQEVFLRAARCTAEVEDPRRWLATIARNYCRDEIRRRRRRPTVGGDQLPEQVSTEDPAAQAVSRVMISSVLSALRPREKRVLLEAVLRDEAPAVIASNLGTNVGAVRVMLLRARRRAAQVAETGLGCLVGWWLVGRRRLGLSVDSGRDASVAAGAASVLLAAVILGGAALPASTGVPQPTRGSAPGLAMPSLASAHVRPAPPSAPAANPALQLRARAVTPLLGPALHVDQNSGRFQDIEPTPSYSSDHTIYAAGYLWGWCQPECPTLLFRSTDSGHSWRRLAGLGFGGGQLLISPEYAKNSTLYAVNDLGLQVSRDGGQTWLTPGIDLGPLQEAHLRGAITAISSGGDRIVFDSDPLLVYDTASGRTRVGPTLPGVTNAFDVAFGEDPDHVLVAAAWGLASGSESSTVLRCYLATDACLSVPAFDDTPLRLLPSPAFASDRTIFARSQGRLFESRDGGASWSQAALGGLVVSTAGLSPSFPADHRLVVWGTYPTLGWTVVDAQAGAADVTGTAASSRWTVDSLLPLPDGNVIGSVQSLTDMSLIGLMCSHDGGRTWTKSC